MNNYVIFTDSACDMPAKVLEEWGVRYVSLGFSFDGGKTIYKDREMPADIFYAKMREGGIAKTFAVDVDTFAEAFEQAIQEGNDILYIAFSSGLSATYQSGRLALERLSEKYPEHKLMAVDTLSASAGFGLLLYHAACKKRGGMDIEALAKYVEEIRMHLCHWFTVDDLVYLKRGGRFGLTAAFVGNVLGIKPVLYIDGDGRLTKIFKVRGRKHAIEALADKLSEMVLDKEGTVYISHGDCMDDVALLEEMLKEKCGVTVDLVADVGPVIGAHCGPGTLALFFIGKER